MRRYIVCDAVGNCISKPFSTRKEALEFILLRNRPQWSIKLYTSLDRHTTQKQKAAVVFCEQWCHVSFKGDIDNFYEVSNFLEDYLDAAKEVAQDARESYWSYLAGY